MAQRISRLQAARTILIATIGCAFMSTTGLAESTIEPISTKFKPATFASNLGFDRGGNVVRLTSSQVYGPGGCTTTNGCVTPGYQLDSVNNGVGNGQAVPGSTGPDMTGVDPKFNATGCRQSDRASRGTNVHGTRGGCLGKS